MGLGLVTCEVKNFTLEQEQTKPTSSSPKNVCVSICVQSTGVCQSTGGGNKSHLVTALVTDKFDDCFLI